MTLVENCDQSRSISNAAKIGIRREDLISEKRAALSPHHVKKLISNGIDVIVERSSIRIFSDKAYKDHGATLVDSLNDIANCSLVLGIKEIKIEKLRRGQAYACFSHTIKGQKKNMPLLAKIIEGEHALIDYECIRDTDGKRLVFFGFHAGVAGAVNSIWAYGKRHPQSVFAHLKQCKNYRNIDQIRDSLRALADTSGSNQCLSVAVLGSGNAGRGALSILGELPDQLIDIHPYLMKDLYLHRIDKTFVREDYLNNPHNYESIFRDKLANYDVILNCVYWEHKYPRLVTADDLDNLFRSSNPPRLHVIGDVSCDVNGAIEVTQEITWPEKPCYLYNTSERKIVDLDNANETAFPTEATQHAIGPTIMAVYNLPAEVPQDASNFFGDTLCPLLIESKEIISQQKWQNLTEPLRSALIVNNGKLQSQYTYLQDAL